MYIKLRLLSFANQPSDNAPEGIHQDGADYIISAMILNKHNIENDTSVIYDENKKEIFRTNLNTGDFIFQDDIKLWHDIKPINAVRQLQWLPRYNWIVTLTFFRYKHIYFFNI